MNTKAPKRFDRIVVFDCEYTMREDNADVRDFEPEIVEFGWCLLDVGSMFVVDAGESFIRPTKTKIGPALRAFTGRERFPRGALVSREVLAHLKRLGLGQYISASYGDDRTPVEKLFPGLLSGTWIDVAALVALRRQARASLESEYRRVQHRLYQTFELQWHTARDDAIGCALVLSEILNAQA